MKINELLNKALNWKPILNNVRDFFCESFDDEECILRMNNFPEEPLWTLFFYGESIDFDDTPENWNITYRNG